MTHVECIPRALQRQATNWLGRLGETLGIPDLRVFLDELLESPQVLDRIEQSVADVACFRKKKWASALELGLYRIVNYALVRGLQPAIFMETGVLHGLTSHVILTAIGRNGSGRLVSIDAPSYFQSGPANHDGFSDTLPPGKEPGWIVSPDHRAAWRLVIGRSLDLMPDLLASLGSIDVFVHDSEHTVQTMLGEMELAWPALRPGGVLICDNVAANDAFATFCRRVDREPVLVPEGIRADNAVARFGVIRK